jgi:hypothetical protein
MKRRNPKRRNGAYAENARYAKKARTRANEKIAETGEYAENAKTRANAEKVVVKILEQRPRTTDAPETDEKSIPKKRHDK